LILKGHKNIDILEGQIRKMKTKKEKQKEKNQY